MFWQQKYIREAIGMTLNSTYKLALPENGLLGSILLRVSGSQASGYGQGMADWRIIDRLTKLVVLGNGGEIIKSLTGLEVQALACWDQGVMPPSAWKNYATNTQWCWMLLNFGTKLFDPDHGLDLSQWDDVELQFTNDATSSQFSDLTVSVMGHYLRDAPDGQFNGYMRTEEWKAWTTVADETIYSSLPTKGLLRRILLQAIPNVDSDFVEQTNQWNLMDDIELSLDTGEVRVYKGGLDDIVRANFYDLGKPLIVGGSAYQSADDGIDLSLGYIMAAVAGAGSNDGAVAATIATLESGRTSFTQKMETYEGDSPANILAMGVSPFLTALFRFDHQPDPVTWLDPGARQTVQLDIHTRNASSSASGRNAIVLDRLITQVPA